MAAFPALSRSPGHTGFVEDLNARAVGVASKASGLPMVNKLFTFNPESWRYILNLVSQADKEAIITHYKANCDIPFDWLNEQNDVTYEVIYAKPPVCRLDKSQITWKISLTLTQYSPL